MIFEDFTKRRRKKAIVIFGGITAVGIFLIIQLVLSLFINSPLTDSRHILKSRWIAIHNRLVTNNSWVQSQGSGIIIQTKYKNYKKLLHTFASDKNFSGGIGKIFPNEFIESVFLIKNDQQWIDDLKKNISNIDLVFTDWYQLWSWCTLNNNVDEDSAWYLFDQKTIFFPRFANNDESGNRLGNEFSSMLHNQTESDCIINNLVNEYQNHWFDGINLDIEDLSSQDTIPFVNRVEALTTAFHNQKMYVTIDLPLNDDVYDYEALSTITDGVVIMAYDEHYTHGEPWSIASNQRFQEWVKDVLKRVIPSKTLIALWAYSYDWNISQKSAAESLSFDDAVALAKDVWADIETETGSVNSTFSYLDDHNNTHQVRMLDTISAWNQYYFARENKALGASLWRIGIEDPSLWKFFWTGDIQSFNPQILSETNILNPINFNGNWEILKVKAAPETWYRDMTLDGKYIDYANYQILPTSYDIERYGHMNDKFVALTFDDWPDPIYTPQILDVLKKNKAYGTFFLVWDQVQRYPEIVQETVRAWNTVGNHTFLHPNIQKISERRLSLEVNINERLIESVIGKKTYLFRAPYDTDSSPSTADEIRPLYHVSQMWYIIVDADIDSKDYDKPWVDMIIKNVLDGLDQTQWNIIVMHDAWWDRKQTVEALNKLIPLLRSKWYTIGTLADILKTSPTVFMPNISLREHFVIRSDWFLIFLHTRWRNIIVILFLLTTIFSIFRILFLWWFVLFSGRKQGDYLWKDRFTPAVSVLIPSYNEGKVIEKTLKTLQKSNYSDFEMVVIDDWSTDDTWEKTLAMAKKDPRIKLIRKENWWKFSALNLWFKQVKNEYIVTIDADTVVTQDTIRHLVSPFENKEVDAVCGNVEVGNVKNILTWFQSVEYITSQNYDRRAFDILGCISVVPWATGAWKKSKVLEVWGYSWATLTEDADLTITMLEHGAKIVYNPFAIGITEAPETVSWLYKQRFRWTYGTYQCLWKHKKNFFKWSLGWIALPNIFIFQVIFPILSPIWDLVLILSLFRGDFRAIAFWYILFLLMDTAWSLIAFVLDNKPKWLLLLVLIQRFFYRQFMYVIAFKAMKNILKGSHHGWNKLERTNSITLK